MDEWQDLQKLSSEFEDPMYAILSCSALEIMQKLEWSSEEEKLFEKAVAEIDPSSLAFFETLALRVPWRSVDEIKKRYQAFLDDLKMVESAECSVADFNEVEKDGSPPNTASANPKPRRKSVPWTEEEHQLFLIGLDQYGRGNWRSISKYLLMNKTPAQIASHAQKYYRTGGSSSTPLDFQTQNPNFSSITPSPAADFLSSSSTNGDFSSIINLSDYSE